MSFASRIMLQVCINRYLFHLRDIVYSKEMKWILLKFMGITTISRLLIHECIHFWFYTVWCLICVSCTTLTYLVYCMVCMWNLFFYILFFYSMKNSHISKKRYSYKHSYADEFLRKRHSGFAVESIKTLYKSNSFYQSYSTILLNSLIELYYKLKIQ